MSKVPKMRKIKSLCCDNLILDNRFSILDMNYQNSQNVIEYQTSSIQYRASAICQSAISNRHPPSRVGQPTVAAIEGRHPSSFKLRRAKQWPTLLDCMHLRLYPYVPSRIELPLSRIDNFTFRIPNSRPFSTPLFAVGGLDPF